jgi:hypothetical protein
MLRELIEKRSPLFLMFRQDLPLIFHDKLPGLNILSRKQPKPRTLYLRNPQKRFFLPVPLYWDILTRIGVPTLDRDYGISGEACVGVALEVVGEAEACGVATVTGVAGAAEHSVLAVRGASAVLVAAAGEAVGALVAGTVCLAVYAGAWLGLFIAVNARRLLLSRNHRQAWKKR